MYGYHVYIHIYIYIYIQLSIDISADTCQALARRLSFPSGNFDNGFVNVKALVANIHGVSCWVQRVG